jgi:Lamin Tail Domain
MAMAGAPGGAGRSGGSGGGAGAGGTGSGGRATAVGGSDGLTPVPRPSDLAIVEMLINPTGTDTGREWIEVVNQTGHALSLAGLHISDAVNDVAIDFGVPAAHPLPAGGRAVFIQSGDPAKNGGVVLRTAIPDGIFGTLVSLNNDADTISVCIGPCSTGVIIDRVAWDGSAGVGYEGHALVIDEIGRRCPAILPFGDAASFGTPGAANNSCP